MLIDSDVLIWYIRGNKNAQDVIKNNIPFKISVINYMEIIQGMKDKRELNYRRAKPCGIDKYFCCLIDVTCSVLPKYADCSQYQDAV